MSQFTVSKDDAGRLVGLGEKGRAAYAKFRRAIDELEPGETFTLSAWFPRSGPFHRRHFALLARLFDVQEQFDDEEHLRLWLQVGAGHCEFVPGPSGRMCAIPKSVAWHKLDEAAFESHHQSLIAFLRSPHAQAFLWPHLEDKARADLVEDVLSEFGA